MTRKGDKGDQPSGGETTWTNTGATHDKAEDSTRRSFGDDMLRPGLGSITIVIDCNRLQLERNCNRNQIFQIVA